MLVQYPPTQLRNITLYFKMIPFNEHTLLASEQARL